MGDNKRLFYIVPLNEKGFNLRTVRYMYNRPILDLNDQKSLSKIKNHLRKRLKAERNKNISQLIDLKEILDRDINTINEKERLAEFYMISVYALINQEFWYSSELNRIDVISCLDELIQRIDSLNYIVNRSHIENLNSQLLIGNTEDVYMIMGSDLIRMVRPEIRTYEGFKLFFDKYSAWSYMIMIDKKSYDKIKLYLADYYKNADYK